MLFEKQNPPNPSLIFSNQCRASRENFEKSSFERIIHIPKAKTFKYKSPNRHIEIVKQPLIQKTIREIEEKKSFLIKFVINQRNFLSSRISRFLFKAHSMLSVRKTILINRIIILRTYSVTLIQNRFRTFITHRHFKRMLHNTNAIFFYTFKYTKGTSIAVNVKRDLIPMQYSKYLQCYFLQIKKKVLKRRIKVHFIINGTKIIDSRYAVMNDGKGNYHNIIPTASLYRRVKERSPKYYKRSLNESIKFYEHLFECKRKKSIDCSSVSDRSDISTELNHNMLWSYTYKKITELKQVKSILKNKSCQLKYRSNRNDAGKKSVSFNNMIELSY